MCNLTIDMVKYVFDSIKANGLTKLSFSTGSGICVRYDGEENLNGEKIILVRFMMNGSNGIPSDYIDNTSGYRRYLTVVVSESLKYLVTECNYTGHDNLVEYVHARKVDNNTIRHIPRCVFTNDDRNKLMEYLGAWPMYAFDELPVNESSIVYGDVGKFADYTISATMAKIIANSDDKYNVLIGDNVLKHISFVLNGNKLSLRNQDSEEKLYVIDGSYIRTSHTQEFPSINT